MPVAKKKKEKKTKVEKKLRPVKQEPLKLEKLNFPLMKEEVMWEDAYPFILQTLKGKDSTFEVRKYFELSSPDLTSFLIKVIRSENSPPFLKNNFKKIKKFIEKELASREKLFLSLSREQVAAFKSFFKQESYFDRFSDNEYFENELEMVYVDFLRSYIDTPLYESRVRSQIKKRNVVLEKHS